MRTAVRQTMEQETEPVRVLGRGLRARRDVHLTLRALRDGVGKTQLEVARESQIDQSDISRLESRVDLDGCQVATLARYVEALGGKLELVARFDDKTTAVPDHIEPSRRW